MNGRWIRAVALLSCAAWVMGCAPSAAPPTRDARAEAQGASIEAIVAAELDRLVEVEGARRAAIVVLDPRDGRVLASAGRGPDGDGEAAREAEVGSTIKPLTVAAALDAGLDPSARFDGEGGRWQADGATLLADAHPRRSMSVEDVLVASSNVGAGKIVREVGEAPIARLFGEIGARVSEPPRSWLAHGAGIEVRMSPRALAGAYAAFANGGLAIEPSADGSGARRRIVSERSAHAVLAMLEAAVGDEGTGHRARVEGLRVAGKTGTTSDGAAVFAGLAGVDAPRWVIVVRAEAEGAWGGSLAAPSFARVAAALARR